LEPLNKISKIGAMMAEDIRMALYLKISPIQGLI
jgi:hypothetical protein